MKTNKMLKGLRNANKKDLAVLAVKEVGIPLTKSIANDETALNKEFSAKRKEQAKKMDKDLKKKGIKPPPTMEDLEAIDREIAESIAGLKSFGSLVAKGGGDAARAVGGAAKSVKQLYRAKKFGAMKKGLKYSRTAQGKKVVKGLKTAKKVAGGTLAAATTAATISDTAGAVARAKSSSDEYKQSKSEVDSRKEALEKWRKENKLGGKKKSAVEEAVMEDAFANIPWIPLDCLTESIHAPDEYDIYERADRILETMASSVGGTEKKKRMSSPLKPKTSEILKNAGVNKTKTGIKLNKNKMMGVTT